jgi:hypothetical protein
MSSTEHEPPNDLPDSRSTPDLSEYRAWRKVDRKLSTKERWLNTPFDPTEKELTRTPSMNLPGVGEDPSELKTVTEEHDDWDDCRVTVYPARTDTEPGHAKLWDRHMIDLERCQ